MILPFLNRVKPAKDRPFPQSAEDYFDQLRTQYELLFAGGTIARIPSIDAMFARLDAAPDTTTWADIFALQTAYFMALPDYRLGDEVKLMRARFQSVAGDVAFKAYAATVPSDIGKLTSDQQRSELLALAERTRYLITFVPPKEQIRNRLGREAMLWTVVLFLISQGVSAACAFGVLKFPMPTILIVVFGGALGGFLSVQARLNKPDMVDPLYKALQLQEGKFSVVVLAPLSGAIFACVLYWLFLSGLMTGGLFPTFGPFDKHGKTGLDRETSVAYGKLLVWSFIAGFAERFVPNVIDRLAGQASPASSTATATPSTQSNADASR